MSSGTKYHLTLWLAILLVLGVPFAECLAGLNLLSVEIAFWSTPLLLVFSLISFTESCNQLTNFQYRLNVGDKVQYKCRFINKWVTREYHYQTTSSTECYPPPLIIFKSYIYNEKGKRVA